MEGRLGVDEEATDDRQAWKLVLVRGPILIRDWRYTFFSSFVAQPFTIELACKIGSQPVQLDETSGCHQTPILTARPI